MKDKFTALEVGIFAVVSLIFLNSLYSLFRDGKDSSSRGPTSIVTSERSGSPAARPESKATSAKARKTADFAVYETKCQADGELYETTASKVRILGPLCGISAGLSSVGSSVFEGGGPARAPAAQLSSVKVENLSLNFNATVFDRHGSNDFSTEFIPLREGRNHIQMTFAYKPKRNYIVDMSVVRKTP